MKHLFLAFAAIALFSFSSAAFNTVYTFADDNVDHSELIQQQQQQQGQETEQQRQERLQREREQEEQRGEQRGRQEEMEEEMEMQEQQRGMEQEGEEINVDQLPEAIQNRIQREYRGASIETAKRHLMENGEMVYEIKMTTPDEGEVTKKFRADGREYEDDKKQQEKKEERY